MKQQSTNKNWVYVPVLLTGLLGFGCHNNDKAVQPSVSLPTSTASTTTTTMDPATMVAPSAETKTTSATTEASTTAAAMPAAQPEKPAVSVANLNDMQIADVVKAANDAEIGAGTLAKTRAENPQVRAFAKMMIDDHAKNSMSEKEMLNKKSDSMTSENEVAKSMREESAEKLSKLKNMSGSAFDQAYIDGQVKMHKHLLSDLDNNLIPAAKDAKLKSYLQETRKHVSQHLEGAQQVLSMINSGI